MISSPSSAGIFLNGYNTQECSPPFSFNIIFSPFPQGESAWPQVLLSLWSFQGFCTPFPSPVFAPAGSSTCRLNTLGGAGSPGRDTAQMETPAGAPACSLPTSLMLRKMENQLYEYPHAFPRIKVCSHPFSSRHPHPSFMCPPFYSPSSRINRDQRMERLLHQLPQGHSTMT